MEKVNPNLKTPLLLQTQKDQGRDPNPFKTFLAGFSKNERKQFLNNMTRHLNHIIARQMRKMKEANERLKESFQKK